MTRALSRWEDVPFFDSEEAEADFWAENKPDVRLMESAVAASSDLRVDYHYPADGPPHARPDQADGTFPLSQLSKHDQTMAE